ncbi:alpha/beta hydrolase-fold protein [Lysobacter koreensis]|uniref:Alpha/beta hydrolase-fold protein n=1 Tax=Lysobacter koreensis TaxID=266122 RepID=A0ABW2YUS9_9GAMM
MAITRANQNARAITAARPPWRLLQWLMLVWVALLAGCAAGGDPSQPIPTSLISAPQPPQRLMVVLPGRADDLRALQRSGVVEAIQRSWPDTDVVLAELTLPYYLDGTASRRLHEQVIAPARQRGYREIWLSGASMGGMGTLMYDQAYPGQLDGLVLLAPFLGERAILQEVAGAGGVAGWDAGPAQAVTRDTWQHELWRHVQGLSRDPARARRVWLAYGDHDKLRKAMPLLTPALRPEQVLVRPGGHSWRVWSPALGDVLEAADPQ